MDILSLLFVVPMLFAGILLEVRIFNEAILGFILPIVYVGANRFREFGRGVDHPSQALT